MTEHAPDRFWSGIDITKTLAGALAAVCAAVLGSFLGVAGTLAGAAVASIVGSLGTELYARSISRGTRKLQTLAPTFIKAPAAVGTPEVAAASEEDSPSHLAATPAVTETRERQQQPARTLHWRRIAAAAAVLFVLAMGSLTLVELMAGRSVASMVGNTTSGTTTVSSVTGGGSDSDKPAPAVTESPSEEPSDERTAPTEEPSTEPTEAPATTPPATEPAPGPATRAPTTDAPQQTQPADPPQQGQQNLDQGTE